jgi:Protein of unknown function (DUF2867)
MRSVNEKCPAETDVLKPFLTHANHVDVKQVEGNVTLERFMLGMLSYSPWWLRMLYRVRVCLVKILGLDGQHPEVGVAGLIPREVSFQPGETVLFFTVRCAKRENYWIAETPEDKHLKAYLAVLAQPSAADATVFRVVTIVHYKHWTGPVYFNLIRPFHHLVVSRMAHAGARHC